MSYIQDGHNIIVIGTSMGGIETLKTLFSQLPSDFPGTIFIVMHLHPNSPSIMDRILGEKSPIPVTFAKDGEVPQPGHIYLAPPDNHLLLGEKRITLSRSPRENRSRPAIDPLFRSAAAIHTTHVIGIVLTGSLNDGTAGLQAIKECGGITVVENPATAAFPEMPQSALDTVEVDYCITLLEIGELLIKLVTEPADLPPAVPEHLRKEVNMLYHIIDPDIKEHTPTQFICPECGGSLNEIIEGNIIRYRCHQGHAYTTLSFLDAQWEKIEYSLWTSVRLMEEQAYMIHRMTRYDLSGQQDGKHATELRAYAEQLKNICYTMKKKQDSLL